MRPIVFVCACLVASALAGVVPGAVSAAEATDGSKVVVSQGGISLTFAEIDAFAQGIPEDKRFGFFNSPKRIQSTLMNLLLQKQLAAQARELGLDRDPAVQAQLALAVDTALAKIRTAQFRAKLVIPDLAALAKEEYQAHPERYRRAAQRNMERIVVAVERGADGEPQRLKAEQIAAEAQAAPDTFPALVEKYSDEPGKEESKGRFTYVGKDGNPAVDAAVGALQKPGAVSPAVRTDAGYEIFRFVAEEPERQQTFDEVRDRIMTRLRGEFIRKEVTRFLDELRNRSLDEDEGALDSLRTRYQTEGGAAAAAPRP